MTCVSYVGKVLKDGHLSLPKGAREALQLEAGQEVEVLVRTRDNAQQLSDEAYAPLRTLIGLAQTGKRDASVQHDTYLYGNPSCHLLNPGASSSKLGVQHPLHPPEEAAHGRQNYRNVLSV